MGTTHYWVSTEGGAVAYFVGIGIGTKYGLADEPEGGSADGVWLDQQPGVGTGNGINDDWGWTRDRASGWTTAQGLPRDLRNLRNADPRLRRCKLRSTRALHADDEAGMG